MNTSIIKDKQPCSNEECNARVSALLERASSFERELEKRNESVFQIQRNFESVSQIASKLKQTNAELYRELEGERRKSEKFDELQSQSLNANADLKAAILALNIQITTYQNEENKSKRQIAELLRIRIKASETEKELNITTLLKKDLEIQITELSSIVKKAEATSAELKVLKERLPTVETALKVKRQDQIKALLVIRLKEVRIVYMQDRLEKAMSEIAELKEHKQSLYALQAEHLRRIHCEQLLSEQKSKEVVKLQHDNESLMTKLHVNQNKTNHTLSQLRHSQSNFDSVKENLIQLDSLREEVRRLKTNCQCHIFPRLFSECSAISKAFQGDSSMLVEDQYCVILKSQQEKMLNLINTLSRVQSSYKKLLSNQSNAVNQPVQLLRQLEEMKETLRQSEELIVSHKVAYSKLEEVLTKISLSDSSKLRLSPSDKAQLIHEALVKRPSDLLETQLSQMKKRNQRLNDENQLLEIEMRNYKNAVNDLEESLKERTEELHSTQNFKQLSSSLISFVNTHALLESLLQTTMAIDTEIIGVRQTGSIEVTI